MTFLFPPSALPEQLAPRNPNRPDGVAHMYPSSLAARLAEKPGSRWRPANGTEGEMFAAEVCVHCFAWDDGGCSISVMMAVFSIDDPEYPSELQIAPSGQPRCTAFKEAF